MHRKMLFETMQNELEEVTEMLSQMVARVYLRTPKAKIVETAQLLQQARLKFVDAVANGLIPSSPSFRDKMKSKKLGLYYSFSAILIFDSRGEGSNNDG